MKLLGRRLLTDFATEHSDSRKRLAVLMNTIENAAWESPHDIKRQYPKASVVNDGNIVFDLCHNKYRVWVHVDYVCQLALVKNIGTHKEYDKWKI